MLLPPQLPSAAAAAVTVDGMLRAVAGSSSVQVANTQQAAAAAAVQTAVTAAQQALPLMSPQHIVLLLTVMADLATVPGAVNAAVRSRSAAAGGAVPAGIGVKQGSPSLSQAVSAQQTLPAAAVRPAAAPSRNFRVEAVAVAVGQLGLAQPQAVRERLASF